MLEAIVSSDGRGEVALDEMSIEDDECRPKETGISFIVHAMQDKCIVIQNSLTKRCWILCLADRDWSIDPYFHTCRSF